MTKESNFAAFCFQAVVFRCQASRCGHGYRDMEPCPCHMERCLGARTGARTLPCKPVLHGLMSKAGCTHRVHAPVHAPSHASQCCMGSYFFLLDSND